MNETFKRAVCVATIPVLLVIWGRTGTVEAVKQGNDFGKGMAQAFAAHSSTGRVVSGDPLIPNTIIGSPYEASQSGQLELNGWVADSTDLNTLFAPST